MKRLELSAAARADLTRIWLYTSEHWGTDQAERYGDLLNAGMKSLVDGHRGPSAPVAGYFRLVVESHSVFYREDGNVVRVVRVLHQKMDARRHLPE